MPIKGFAVDVGNKNRPTQKCARLVATDAVDLGDKPLPVLGTRIIPVLPGQTELCFSRAWSRLQCKLCPLAEQSVG